MASEHNNDGDIGGSYAGSPMNMGLSSHFSHEDIQDLLGVMGDTSHGSVHGSEDHHHQPLMLTSSDHHLQQQAAAVAAAGTTPVACATITYGNDGRDMTSSGEVVADNNTNNSCNGNQPGEDAKAHARSERKRSREKQRRSDVNKQFTDLTQLLQKIDAEDAAAAAAEAAAAASSTSEELVSCDAKSSSTSSAAAAGRITFNPSNRVDLIGRTILQLERLHEANKRRKNEIASLQQQLDVAKKAGEDTAAKLKEAMLAPPGQPMTKVCFKQEFLSE